MFVALVKHRKNKWFGVSDYCQRINVSAGSTCLSDFVPWSGGTISVMDNTGFHT